MSEIYPVVHINNGRQTADQAKLALDSGADGVYLINHHYAGKSEQIMAFNRVADENPDSFIGMNILYAPSSYAAFQFVETMVKSGAMIRYPDGLWVDDASNHANATVELRKNNLKLARIRYLGGVAFKYTDSFTEGIDEAVAETHRWAEYVDVVTTSGGGTGVPPTVEKIIAMKTVLGNQPLAVASGLSAENLPEYDGHIDQVLVSSSIEAGYRGSGIFSKKRLDKIIEVAHSL